ncbi:MAG: diguanylate cyclase domain-containing protein [Mycobacterium sp.]
MDLAQSAADSQSKDDLGVPGELPILLVDDDAQDLKNLENCLLNRGFQNIQGVLGGTAAIDVLNAAGGAEEAPGVVILDIHMPPPGGYEVLAHIKAMDPSCRPLALAITGDSSPATRIATLQAGASDFIIKQFDEVELFLRVNNLATLTYQARELQRRTEQAIAALVEAVPDSVVIVGADGRIAQANSRTEQMFGYEREALLGMEIEMLLPPRFRRKHTGYRTDFWADPTIRSMGAGRELWGLRGDGREFPAEVSLGPLHIGQHRHVAATITDITELRSVRQSQSHLAAVVQSSDDAIISITTGGVVQTCNPGAERLLDRAAARIVGQPVETLMPADSKTAFAESCQQVCDGMRVERRQFQMFRRYGAVVDVAANIFALRDTPGYLVGYSLIARDITAETQAQRALERLARFDTLTGLNSRAETLTRLKAALECSRSPGQALGVLFCDVDDFKSINDTLGHDIGDAVLTTLATRIRESLRQEDTVGRTGGDELLVLLPGLHSLDEAVQIAEKIRCHAAEPMHPGGHTTRITLSIGVTLAIGGESVRAAMSRADSAMYQAKKAGRNSVSSI